jgi:hypothetical protein
MLGFVDGEVAIKFLIWPADAHAAAPYRFAQPLHTHCTQGSHLWPRVCVLAAYIFALWGCRNSIIASAVREINLIRSCCCAAPHAVPPPVLI